MLVGLTWRYAGARLGIRSQRQWTPKHELLGPRHLVEVAELVCLLSPHTPLDPSRVRVGTTSLDICISAGKIESATGSLHHFTLSRRDAPLTEEAAALVANLIRRLRQPAAPSELRSGRQGVFHLLIHAQTPKADSSFVAMSRLRGPSDPSGGRQRGLPRDRSWQLADSGLS